ncbi:MAG: hypothetical protein K6E36_12790 [Oscillospiraceae bacterium]|nr:hypothetical protein [Oscillospiraceae bacterium]
MKKIDMRLAFKVFNILILIYYGIVGVMMILKLFGITEEAADAAPGLGFFAVVVALITLIPVLLVIFMAREGLRENYELCAKIAMAVVVLDIIGFMMSTSKSASGLIGIFLGIIYIFMAKTAE